MLAKSFGKYYRENLKLVEEGLDSFLESEEERRMRALTEYSLRKGKRLRPVICLLTSDIYGLKPESALRNAVLIELIHGSTLVHDDVTDNDIIRRDMSSLWKHLEELPCGKPKLEPRNLAVLLGDGMLSRALCLIQDIDTLYLTSKVIQDIARGALREAYQLQGGEGNLENYMEMILLKTGSLFGLATQLGSRERAPANEESIARAVGIQLGMVYQMADDLSDGDLRLDRSRVENLLLVHCGEFIAKLSGMPGNEYREIMRDAPGYIVNAMMEEGGKSKRLVLKGDNFHWEDT